MKKVAALTVATNEQLADQSMNGERDLLKDLLAACAEALDRSLLDRLNVGSADEPASVTSACTPIPYTGSLDNCLAMAIRQLSDAGSTLRDAYWVMPSYLAAALALTRDASGALAYPLLGALGGSIAGIPVLTSASAEAEVNTDELSDITLLDASQISFAEGPPDMRVTDQALIEMDSAPTGVSTGTPTAASATRMALWQVECSALMASMSVNWRVRRPGMVQCISNVPSVMAS